MMSEKERAEADGQVVWNGVFLAVSSGTCNLSHWLLGVYSLVRLYRLPIVPWKQRTETLDPSITWYSAHCGHNKRERKAWALWTMRNSLTLWKKHRQPPFSFLTPFLSKYSSQNRKFNSGKDESSRDLPYSNRYDLCIHILKRFQDIISPCPEKKGDVENVRLCQERDIETSSDSPIYTLAQGPLQLQASCFHTSAGLLQIIP